MNVDPPLKAVIENSKYKYHDAIGIIIHYISKNYPKYIPIRSVDVVLLMLVSLQIIKAYLKEDI